MLVLQFIKNASVLLALFPYLRVCYHLLPHHVWNIFCSLEHLLLVFLLFPMLFSQWGNPPALFQ
jgi:hypothetical protein